VDKRMRTALAVALFVWVALLFILSTLQKRNPRGVSFASMELPAYPEAVKIERHRVSDSDWQTVQYKVNLPCPSDKVYAFYDRWFRESGWHRLPGQKPAWERAGRGKGRPLTFAAGWLDERELLRADLRLTCAPTEAGTSEMSVNCATTRVVLPRHQTAEGQPLPQ
jgi:hypothetical protein